MNDSQAIKRMLMPYIKGLPFITLLLVFAVSSSAWLLRYVVPKYESTAKMKIENEDEGVSSLNLYKDFNVFSVAHKMKTIEEILKSKEVIKSVVLKLDRPITYHREGEMRTSEMYNDSPFLVNAYDIEKKYYDKQFRLVADNEKSYHLFIGETKYHGKFDEPIKLGESWIQINLNNQIIEEKGADVSQGNFYFTIHSLNAQIAIIKGTIDIAGVDKDIPIVRISYKDEVPERAATIVNTLAEVYISDYVNTKSDAARKTVEFIDLQLNEISQKLSKAEVELEYFKRKYKVINTRQETETGLKEISQLQMNLVALEIDNVAMDSVLANLDFSPNDSLGISLNFEAFSDLIFTEVVNDINLLLAQRRELLQKFKPNSEQVVLINQKITDLKEYLKESISKSKINIETKKENMQMQVNEAEKQFAQLPEREKKFIILEREFMLNQKIYNFLSEKRIESSIVQAADLSFHRIIERGAIASQPVAPNKKFLVIISGFLAVLTAISLIYGKVHFAAKTITRFDVEKVSLAPIIGITRKYKKDSPEIENDFTALLNELFAKNKIAKNQLLVVSSAERNEGKTFIAKNLAEAFVAIGWKTAIIDFNIKNGHLTEKFELTNQKGLLQLENSKLSISDIMYQPDENKSLYVIPAGHLYQETRPLFSPYMVQEKIKVELQNFDIIIADTPANAITNDALLLMKQADCVLQVIRSGHTKPFLVRQADILKESYGFNHINLILNAAPKASNYNGMFSGSRFSYNTGKGFFNLIRHYFNFYLK